MTCSGLPSNFLRSTGSCVATPTGTGVEVALAHHDAAFDHERRGGEAELVGAEQRADDDVAAGLHLAVGLDRDAPAQAVQHQRLLRFGEPELPRRAGVLDRRPAARRPVPPSWPEIVTWSDLPLDTPAATVPTPTSETSFTEIGGLRIRVLQIVDQLRQVLDRIDVVVRRRRDQLDAGRRVAQQRDVLGDLAPRKLAAFAGLGALRHLDLQHLGARQVFRGDAEAAGGDLLDLRLERVARACSSMSRLDAALARAATASVSPALTGA